MLLPRPQSSPCCLNWLLNEGGGSRTRRIGRDSFPESTSADQMCLANVVPGHKTRWAFCVGPLIFQKAFLGATKV